LTQLLFIVAFFVEKRRFFMERTGTSITKRIIRFFETFSSPKETLSQKEAYVFQFFYGEEAGGLLILDSCFPPCPHAVEGRLWRGKVG